MVAGIVACSFCTSVPSASWMPDPTAVAVTSVVVGVAVAVAAMMTWGQRAVALAVVAVALVLVLPAGALLAESTATEVDGVEMTLRSDSDDGTWRVRCESAFPDSGLAADGVTDLAEVCRDAASTRRAASMALVPLGGLMVVGGLIAAVSRPGKHRKEPLVPAGAEPSTELVPGSRERLSPEP